MSGKSKTKFNWTDRHQQAFENIKKIVAKETLLTYPDFTIPFDVHTDSSDYQLGGVVSQLGKPIAFFSRKFKSKQQLSIQQEEQMMQPLLLMQTTQLQKHKS